MTFARTALALALTATIVSAQQAGQPADPPQEPQQDVQKQPTPFRTEANYVRVDVYPTLNGQPVQDLRVDEFEVLEDGNRQEIQAFEHIVISPAGPQSSRVEPNSVRAGEQMAANPRNRVFVVFLDVPHVPVEGSHAIKEPLIRLMDRVMGPDDLVAVMTPEMSAAQVTFSRKTEVIADMLREKWTWGQRHRIVPMDDRETEYERCYPPTTDELRSGQSVSRVVRQMIARRRERMVLDALKDLVLYLGGVREERKAILTISSGWVLFRPDRSVESLRTDSQGRPMEPIPGNEPIGVDPTGKLRIGGARSREGYDISQTACDRERMYLASIDNEDYFRQIMDLANRYNASFYPVDPRGLAVFDFPINEAVPLLVDQGSLRTRVETLRTLAENTDGMAVVNTNDLDRGLRRIADDLTSYYLLGYYSTNTKLDGSYRRITVRVKRPGVDVRARRGYRAATAEEVNASRTAAAAPVPAIVKTSKAALATLDRIRPEQRFSVRAVPARDPATGTVAGVWVTGELQLPLKEFTKGGQIEVEVSGETVGGNVQSLKPGERTFLVKIPVTGKDGTVNVRARAKPLDGEILTDSARIETSSPQPLMYRRGLSTGNRVQPAADFRFSRTERLRLELPIAADTTIGSGRLLDRNAQPLPVPVQVAEKKDPEGQRWLTADATLAALAPGDYVIEVAYTDGGKEQQVLTAIRVTR